jgi:hypothetical protein
VSAVLYCIYSVASPELQRRKIEAARKKRLRLYVVKVRWAGGFWSRLAVHF